MKFKEGDVLEYLSDYAWHIILVSKASVGCTVIRPSRFIKSKGMWTIGSELEKIPRFWIIYERQYKYLTKIGVL